MRISENVEITFIYFEPKCSGMDKDRAHFILAVFTSLEIRDERTFLPKLDG